MKDVVEFLINVNKLKELRRTGWVWLGVKNPETVADHSFQLALLSWLLAETKGGLNIEKVIKIAIAHDLCEVWAGDMTAYYDLLPKNPKKRKEFLKRWIRLPQKQKEKRAKEKFNIEIESLLKLLKTLSFSNVRNEIFNSFLDYERSISLEGKFVKQIDKIEPLIQAIEYFGTKEDTPVIGWWEEAEETVEDPFLKNFLKVIEKKFYHKKFIFVGQDKVLNNILNFISETSKLKRMPRSGWVLRKVKNPETVGSHIFMLTLTSWILNRGQNFKLNCQKLVKMALSHELCEVYALDQTPYDYNIKNKKVKTIFFNKWLRLGRDIKEKIFYQDYLKEKKATKKLVKNLPPLLGREIFSLWDDFKRKKSLESVFLNQFYVIETLLQALLYWEKNKNFSINSWWEWAYENLDNETSFQLMDALKQTFYEKN